MGWAGLGSLHLEYDEKSGSQPVMEALDLIFFWDWLSPEVGRRI